MVYPLDNETPDNASPKQLESLALGVAQRISAGIGGREKFAERILESKRPLLIPGNRLGQSHAGTKTRLRTFRFRAEKMASRTHTKSGSKTGDLVPRETSAKLADAHVYFAALTNKKKSA